MKFRKVSQNVVLLSVALTLLLPACRTEDPAGPPAKKSPVISSITPQQGVAGDTIVIQGSQFGNRVGTLRWGDEAIGTIGWSGGTISFVIPSDPAAGTRSINLETLGGLSSNLVDFTVQPQLSMLTPTKGRAGDTVTVKGTNIGPEAGKSEVRIGGKAVKTSAWNNRQFAFQVPPELQPGAHSVTVNIGGEAGNKLSFTVQSADDVITSPAVTAASPLAATAATLITLSGSGFGALQAGSTLTVGGIAVTPESWGDGSISFYVPPEVTAGSAVGIVVTVDGQTSNVTTLAVTPSLIDMPVTGAAGSTLTLSGANFGPAQAGSTLTIGGTAVTIGSWSTTSISFIVPAGVAAGELDAVVAVGGESSTAVTVSIIPSITSLAPVAGLAGTLVTVNGANFGASQGASRLFFDAYAITPASWANGVITFSIPATADVGANNVQVVVNNKTSNTAVFTVTSPGAPVIASLSPASGLAGTIVTVNGSGFGASQGGSSLTFGGSTITPSGWSAATITFAVPGATPTGSYDVVVITGAASNAYAFTVTAPSAPVITAVNPPIAAGGDLITLSGANFGGTQGGSTLAVNGVAVTPASWSAATLTFIFPNTPAAGAQSIVVTVGGAASNTAGLTVVPTLIAATPVSGSVGAAITVTAKNLGAPQGTSTFAIGGVSPVISNWLTGSLTFTVPAAVVAGANNLSVTVGGETSAAISFVVTPLINSLSSVSGFANDTITISGSHFGTTGTVTLGGAGASIVSWSNTSVEFDVPASPDSADYFVQVHSGGQSSPSSPFTIRPDLTGLDPSFATGGDAIDVSGNSFGSSSVGNGVTVGDLAAVINSWSANSVSIDMPANVTAGVRNVRLAVGARFSDPLTLTVLPTLLTAGPSGATAGTLVTVTGTNLGAAQDGSTLTAGGVSITPASWSQTSLTFVLPATVGAGARPIAVNVNGQLSSTVNITVDPTLVSASPTVVTDGTTVTLTGTNFGATQAGSTITIGGLPATAGTWAMTEVEVVVPAGLAVGPHDIVLTAASHPSNALSLTVSAVVPAISGLATLFGTGGDILVINGSNFGGTQDSSSVTFGSVLAQVAAWSDASVSITVPTTVSAGVQSVTVTVDGIASNSLSYTVHPFVSGLSASAGIGGDSLTISGTNFGVAQGTVDLDGVPAVIDSWANGAIAIMIPDAVTTGTRAVRVFAAGIASNTEAFDVNPALSGISPSPATAGNSVTLSGSGFGATQDGSSLVVGSRLVAPASWGATSIVFAVPADWGAGSYATFVTVNSQTSNSLTLHVDADITALSPAAATGGTNITLTGSNFGAVQGGGTVTVGGATPTIAQWSNTQIQFDVPTSLAAGPRDIVLTVGGRPGLTRQLTVLPAIWSALPSLVSGGDALTLTGTGFDVSQGASLATIGGVPATAAPWAGNAITLTIPNDVTAGTRAVELTVNGQINAAVFVTIRPRIATVIPAVVEAGTVTLTGTNFGAAQGASTLGVGGQNLTASAWSQTSISFEVPVVLAPGDYGVAVTVNAQPSLPALFTKSAPDLIVDAVSPAMVTGNVGASVDFSITVKNQGNAGAAASSLDLFFDSTVAGSSCAFPALAAGASSTLTCAFSVPAMVADLVDIKASIDTGEVVTESDEANNDLTLANAFSIRPYLSSLSPSPATGGTSITLFGTAFGPSSAGNSIRIGDRVTTATAWAAGSIGFATANDWGAGVYSASVTVNGQTSNSRSIAIDPALFAVSPAVVTGGTEITVTGSNFGATPAGATLRINGLDGDITTWSMNSAAATVPTGLAPGIYNLVMTAAGRASNAVTVTVSASAPSITSVSPPSGTGGDTVIIAGANFGVTQGASSVSIGGQLASVVSWSGTSVSVTLPTNVAAGVRFITITVFSLSSNSKSVTVLPAIIGLGSAAGTGGDTLTITGTNFGTVQGTVDLDGVQASIDSWLAGSISITIPNAVTSGTRSVRVIANGEFSNLAAFTVIPHITTVAPLAASDGVITLTGGNFGDTEGTSGISIGGFTADVSSWSATSVAVTLPTATPPGAQDVIATVEGEVSNTLSLDVLPLISSLDVSSGSGGDIVNVSGAHFGATGTVTIGGVAATVGSWSTTALDVTIPDTVTAGTTTLVISSGGESSSTAFTVIPRIDSRSPLFGPAGTSITLTGTNFGPSQGGSVLTVGGFAAAGSPWSQLSITLTVPTAVTAGTRNIAVTVGGEFSNAVTFDVKPAVSSVSLSPATGGTTVTLAGSGFGAISAGNTLVVGTTVLASSAWAEGAIDFVVPNTLGAGLYPVSVTVNGQTSNAQNLQIDPVVTTVSPAAATGTTLITLTGSNFGAAEGGSTITVGGATPTVNQWTTTEIKFLVPTTLAAGAHDIVVTVASRPTTARSITVLPAIWSALPSPRTGGNALVLTGTGFDASQGGSTVTIGGVTATAAPWSGTSINLTVPNTVTAGTQSIALIVNGLAAATSSVLITPSITGVTPSPSTGGATLTVTGTNLGASQGGSTVTIAGIGTASATWGQESFTFVLSDAVTAGTRSVIASVAGQTSNASAVTVEPHITSLSPATASTGILTLTGGNFGNTEGSSSVTIGGFTADVASWSATSVAVTLPTAVPPGAQNVIATVEGEVSNILSLDVTPLISSLDVSSGSGGDIVNVSGAHFGATGTVTINGVAATVGSWSTTALDVTVPDTATAGTTTLVITSGGESSSTAFTVIPRIDIRSPVVGPAGTSITLTGTNFGPSQGGSVLSVGGFAVAGSPWSQLSITLTVPTAVTAGTRNIAVTVGGEFSNAVTFDVKPAVSSVSPSPATSGTTVSLSGSGFGAISAGNTLVVGTAVVTSTAWAAGAIDFVVPSTLGAGLYPVSVTVNGQTSNAQNLQIDPAVTTVSPASATGTTLITLTGSNFGAAQGGSTITVGGATPTVNQWTATEIKFLVPTTLAAGAHDIVVTVASRPTTARSITVLPAIWSALPSPRIGGDALMLTGTGFDASQGGSTVTIGGVTATAAPWTATSISLTVPNTVTAGTQSIALTVNGLAAATSSVLITPSLIGVTPSPSTGGATLTVTGTNLGASQGGSTVTIAGIGTASATWGQESFTFVLSDAVTAGTRSVIVTVAGETSNASVVTVEPHLTSLSPATASTGIITLTGGNFGDTEGSSSITIGGFTADVASWSASSVAVTLPTAVPPGAQNVIATVEGEVSNTLTLDVAPLISSLDVSSGSGGDTVNVSGAHFGATGSVTLNGVTATVGSWSTTALDVTVPDTATAGTTTLVITSGGESSSFAFTIIPRIDIRSPVVGPAGTSITLTGTNFGPSQGGSILTVGGFAAAGSPWSQLSITFPLPTAVTAGTRNIVVEVGGEFSNAVTFMVDPALGGVSPSPATGSTLITLSGTGFGDVVTGNSLVVGSRLVTPQSWTPSAIAFTAGTNWGAGSYAVSVTVNGRASGSLPLRIAPSVNTIAPASATATTNVLLTGSNFGSTQGGSTLTVGGVAPTITLWNDLQIAFDVPLSLAAGDHDVVVTVAGEPGTPRTFTVFPAIWSVSPSPSTGNDEIIVTGSGFDLAQGGSTITVGGVGAAVNTWSNNSLKVAVPDSVTAGTLAVVMMVNGHTTNSVNIAIRPAITLVTTSPATGGDTLGITGTSFGALRGASTVTVGGFGVAAQSWAPYALQVTLGDDVTAGTRAVVATVGGQASNSYSITVKPHLDLANPATGGGNDFITLSGGNFGATEGSSTVTFDGAFATVVTWSAAAVTVHVPDHLPAGTVSIVVTVNGEASGALAFTITHGIDSLSPGTGPVGSTLIITGHNLGISQGASSVSIGGVAATVLSWSSNTVRVTVPAAASGSQPVEITVGGVPGNTLFFTVRVPPFISGVAPGTGSGGTVVTLTGTDFGTFGPASGVRIGAFVTPIQSWSNNSVAVTIPADAEPGVHGFILTADGIDSNAEPFTVLPDIDSVNPVVYGYSTPWPRLSGQNFGPAPGDVFLSGTRVDTFGWTWSYSDVEFYLPNSLTAGVHPVTMEAGGVMSNAITMAVAPLVYNLSSFSGPPGSAVNLTGLYYGASQGANKVYFGATEAPVASWAGNAISVTSPVMVTGPAAVTVSVNGIVSNAFTYTVYASGITSLSASTGTYGSAITIYGSGFGAVKGSSTLIFKYNTVNLTATTSTWSDTKIEATVPAYYAGNYSVYVNLNGTTPSNTKNYRQIPKITSRGPIAVLGGAPLTITGTSFQSYSNQFPTVYIGAYPATRTSQSWSKLTVTVPPKMPAGIHNVRAYYLEFSNAMTVAVKPFLVTASPIEGPAGTWMTLTGNNFGDTQGASTAQVGALPADVISWSTNQIVVAIPAGSPPGAQAVNVTIGGLTSNSLSFTVVSFGITAVEPRAGAGNTLVTLTGSGFGAVPGTVSFDGFAVAPDSWSANLITVRVPLSMQGGSRPIVVTQGPESGTAFFVVTPWLSARSPAVGAAATLLTLNGTNFGSAQGSSQVLIGGVSANVVNWFSTAITAEIPASAAAGTQPVLAVVGGAVSNTLFVEHQRPWIHDYFPRNGGTNANVYLIGRYFETVPGYGDIGGQNQVVAGWSPNYVQLKVAAATPVGRQPLQLETAATLASNRVAFRRRGSDMWLPLEEMPTARWGHSSVWTGTEMIVWGGIGSTFFNDGYRYSPVSDTWMPTAMDIATPAARYDAYSVWTGQEMIVWGGAGLSDGARYNPALNAWTSMSNLGQPGVRSASSTVWTGSEMIIWGGATQVPYIESNTGGRYNPLADSWTPTGLGANLPAARQNHSAVWTGSDMIVWGGTTASFPQSYHNTGGRYYPAANSWTTLAVTINTPSPRYDHQAIWTGDSMLVWGGVASVYNAGTGAFDTVAYNTGGVFDPSTGSWASTGTGAGVPTPRSLHRAVFTGSKMLVWGGVDAAYAPTPDGSVYDVAAGTWQVMNNVGAPEGRTNFTAAWTGAEMIVWGGSGPSGSLDTGARYDLAADTWSATRRSDRPAGFSVPSKAIWTGSEMLIWGGSNFGMPTNDGFRYNPVLESWSPVTKIGAPSPRGQHSLTWTGQYALVWGGRNAIWTTVNDGGRYDPATNQWLGVSLIGAPPPRMAHSAVTAGTYVVIWGGDTGAFPGGITDGARYDAALDQWFTMSQIYAPSIRAEHSGIGAGNELIVWGGRDEFFTAVSDGARYNVNTDTWTPLPVTGTPDARRLHSAIWTGSEMIVWGGVDNAFTPLSSGARYNPLLDAWAPTPPPPLLPGPVGRYQHAAVWTGAEMIVWGGQTNMGAVNNGGRYDPVSGTWTVTTLTDAPVVSFGDIAGLWTGDEMIVWGGWSGETQGRYLP